MNHFLKSILVLSILSQISVIYAMEQDKQFALEQESKNKSAQAKREAGDRAVALELQKEQDLAAQSIDQDLKSIEQDAALAPDRCAILAQAIQAHYGKSKLSEKELQQIKDLSENSDICELIGAQYIQPKKLKFLANNMEFLLPAVLDWSKPTLQQHIWIDGRNEFVHYLVTPEDFYIFKQIANAKQKMAHHRAASPNTTTPLTTIVRPGIFIWAEDYMPISELRLKTGDLLEFTRNKNGFHGCCFPNGKTVFKVCGKKFHLLEKLEMRHLEFLISLYQQYQAALSQLHALNDGTTMIRIDLNEEQQKMYHELPRELRTCLDTNYGYLHDLDNPMSTMPNQMVVHSSLMPLPQNIIVGQPARIIYTGTQNTRVGHRMTDQDRARLQRWAHNNRDRIQPASRENPYKKWIKRLGVTTAITGLGIALFNYLKK